MDTFAHGLWSFAIFHKNKHIWWATFFGIMPDLLSFGILFVISILSGNFAIGKSSIISFPSWLYIAYNLTHSLVIFAAIFILFYTITKKWLWPMSAWAIHILIDIPTHSDKFFPTQFLWPLSKYKFYGIIWATPWFMIINYGALVVIFFIILYKTERKRKKKK